MALRQLIYNKDCGNFRVCYG